ncbi:MAG: prolipoprotein diacylglyceryl transferase [Candidatus Omnitrophica bacterium]|nr:prolipoprotein diacylglyceryl transferase [Candidatus Omnitrophota bacterium]
MYPIIFHIGPLSIYSYGLMLALAFIISTSLAKKKAREEGFSPDLIISLSGYLLLGGLIGARIAYVLLNLEEYKNYPLQVFMLQRGGLCYYGALLGGLVGGIIFLKKYKISFSRISDFISPYISLGQAVGRIGCFLRGCCYGKETSFFIRIRFPEELIYRHPTELYAALLNFLIFLVLSKRYKKRKFRGEIFLLYLMLYSAKRFFLDFLRGDLPPLYFGLTIFQSISIFVFVLTIILYFKGRMRFQKDDGKGF